MFLLKKCKNQLLVTSFIILASLLFNASVYAENRWISGTQSERLSIVVSDNVRPRIYLADSANGELIVIDSDTEQVIKRITIDGAVTDMALSKNSRLLDVVADGNVYRIDLVGQKVIKVYNIPTGDGGKPVRSVAFNNRNHIYAVSLYGDSENDRRSEVYVLDWSATNILTSFNSGAFPNFYTGLLKTNRTGTILYIGEQGVSPLSIHKFDIHNLYNPVYLGKNAHGALGSSLKDFAISPRYNEVYIASSGSGIQKVNAETLEQQALLSTGAYPGGTVLSPLGNNIYGLPTSPYNNKLYEFDAQTETLINEYDLLSDVHNGKGMSRGLAIDAFGEKAFVIHGDSHPSYASMKLQVIDLVKNPCGL